MAANHSNVQTVAAPTSTTVYVPVFTSTPFLSSQLIVANGGNCVAAIAFGAAGSEVDYVAVAPNSTLSLNLSLNVLPAGTRISCLAEGAVGSTGYVTVSLLP
jgi:hypothetical protein